MPSRKLATPLPVFPGIADTLVVDNITGYNPPAFRWELRQTIARDSLTQLTTHISLTQGNGIFTTDQWRDWKCNNEDDDAYILSCVAKNLNLKLE